MPALQFPWILADADTVVGVVFMLIAVIGWFSNLMNQKKPPVPPNRRNGPQRPGLDPRTIQSEIEKFLSQARQNQGTSLDERRDTPSGLGQPVAQSARRAPPKERRSRTRNEVWDEQVGKTSSPASPGRKQPASARKQQPRRAPPPSSTSSGPRKTQQLRSAPESRFPQQVRPEQENRLGKLVAQDLAPHIASSVSAHLGAFTAASPDSQGERSRSETLAAQRTPASGLANLMTSRRSVRDAILLSEILAKPRALRR